MMYVRFRSKNHDLVYPALSREGAILQFFRDHPEAAAETIDIREIDHKNVPRIGELVLYRTDGRNGLVYDLPAIITVTHHSHPGNYPDGKANPLPVPLSSFHVHLTVFSPGGFGTKIAMPGDGSFELRDPHQPEEFKETTHMVPGSGTYTEWNVQWAANIISEDYPASRSWRRFSEDV